MRVELTGSCPNASVMSRGEHQRETDDQHGHASRDHHSREDASGVKTPERGRRAPPAREDQKTRDDLVVQHADHRPEQSHHQTAGQDGQSVTKVPPASTSCRSSGSKISTAKQRNHAEAPRARARRERRCAVAEVQQGARALPAAVASHAKRPSQRRDTVGSNGGTGASPRAVLAHADHLRTTGHRRPPRTAAPRGTSAAPAVGSPPRSANTGRRPAAASSDDGQHHTETYTANRSMVGSRPRVWDDRRADGETTGKVPSGTSALQGNQPDHRRIRNGTNHRRPGGRHNYVRVSSTGTRGRARRSCDQAEQRHRLYIS